MITNYYEPPQTDLEAILQELRYRADRVKYYGETFNDWAEFCSEMADLAERWDETMSEEYLSQEQVDDLLREETDELREEVKDLKARIKELEAKPVRRRRKPLPNVLPPHIVRVDFGKRARA